MKNGVPFEIAFGRPDRLTHAERQAMSIVFSQCEGGEFDFDTMEFKKPKQ